MARRNVKVWSCGRSVALSIVAVGLATRLSPTLASSRALQGLDLVEDLTAETIENMKADMSVNFLEAVLLEATVAAAGGGDGGSNDAGMSGMSGGCSTPGVGGCSWPSYSLTDTDGVVHTCTVREDTPDRRAAAKKKPTGKDVSTALDPLAGRCATISHEYWSYKWCHKGEIIQFHDNKDGTTTKVFLGKHTRTEVKRARTVPPEPEKPRKEYTEREPEWMETWPPTEDRKKNVDRLRVYREARAQEEARAQQEEEGADEGGRAGEDSWISRVLKKKKKKPKADSSSSSSSERKSKTTDPYEGINDFSEVAAVWDYYEGGDVCESTGDHRNVRTAITCCTTKMEEADGTSSPMAVLVSLQEVSTCSYLVQVCSRLLCPALEQEAFGASNTARAIGGGQPSASGAAKSSMVPNAGGVLGILEELEACFPMKHEAWWTYRLCFSTGISQFHADLTQKDETGALGVVTDDFSLGKWDKSQVKGQGDDLIQPSEDAAGGAIVLEFTGGTECDLTGVLRSTTVHLKCASVQTIREVLEDSTCHYRIVATSPLLCSHPALVPKATSTRSVECVPEKKRRGMASW